MKKSERKHLRDKNISVLNIIDSEQSPLNLRNSHIQYMIKIGETRTVNVALRLLMNTSSYRYLQNPALPNYL